MWVHFKASDLIRTREEYYLAHPDLAVKNHWPGPYIHWNPGNKVVQDHRDGTICHHLTNIARARRNLPVPWIPEMATEETRLPDIL